MSAEIFVAETGQLTAASKTALRKAGIAVVEVGDITRCQFMRASEVIPANDLSWAAIHALNVDGGYGDTGAKQRERFVANLLTVVAQQTNRLPARRAASSVPGEPPDTKEAA